MAVKRYAGDSYSCLSTDTKPGGVPDGAFLRELDTGKLFVRYSSSWQEAVGSAEWGGIGGTLSDQTDLQNALDDKLTGSLSSAYNWSGAHRFPSSGIEIRAVDALATRTRIRSINDSLGIGVPTGTEYRAAEGGEHYFLSDIYMSDELVATQQWVQDQGYSSEVEDREVVTLGGDFDSGMQVICSKMNDRVMIASIGQLSTSTTQLPASAVGVIPSRFRPAATQIWNTYNMSADWVVRVGILTDGSFLLDEMNWSGNRRTIQNSRGVVSMSFPLPE